MDDLYGILAPVCTDQLPALHSQRRQIVSLTAQIQDLEGRLRGLDPSEFWSSNAQRAYRDRVGEIVHDLRGVVHYLNEAQEQIRRTIRKLEAEE